MATQVLTVGGHEKVVKYAEAIFSPQDIGSATYIAYLSDRNVVGFQLNGTSDGMMLDGMPALGVGGNGGETALIINGVVNDSTGANRVPIADATVTLRKAADNSVLTMTSSAANGWYALTNVPASTDVYVNISKATYASFNSEIMNLTVNLLGKKVMIAPAALIKGAVDLINGSVGGDSWSDPFYTGKGWFLMDIVDTTMHHSIPGVSITVAPDGPVILYNNGSDVFSATGPTVGENNMPLVAGHNEATGIYTFTMTKDSTTHSVKLPLVMGEIVFTEVGPW